MNPKPTKKRIAVIGLKGLPAYGGAAAVGQNIISSLSDTYDFTVYATSSHVAYSKKSQHYKQIVFHKLPLKGLNIVFYYLLSAFYVLFGKKYDLVHLHHIDGAFILPLLRLKCKVILTIHARPQEHGKWNFFVKKLFDFNEKVMLKKANRLTVVGKPLKNVFEKKFTSKIDYIPNGIDKQIIYQKRTNNNIPPKNYILFSAGRIIPIKGCHIMLEALNKIKYQDKILIIGDLNQIKKYKKKLLNLGRALNIEYINLIKEKQVLMNYVKNAKLFIFPSIYEAMSMMLLETASVKTPLICSDIDQNTAVFNKEEVLFFKTENPDDLSEKLLWSLDNYASMKEKSERAYVKLRKHYTWDKIAGAYKELYEELM